MGIYWESLGQQTGSPYGDDFRSLDASLLLDGVRSVFGWKSRWMKTSVLNEPGWKEAFATSVAAMTHSITC